MQKVLDIAPLHWWQWGKLAGCVAIVIFAILLATDSSSPAAIAVLLHLFCDFTSQSSQTAVHKSERGRHLLYHALVAGGLPMAAAGLVHGGAVQALVWTALGIIAHYAVDWTRKFGVRQIVLAVCLDQACHLGLIILVLA